MDRLYGVLIRLFRGVIREGAHDRVLRALHDDVLRPLEANPAVISATLGLSMDAEPPGEYLLETQWRGLDDLIRFAGDQWRIPRLEPAEEEHLVSVSAHHYVTDRVDGPATLGTGPPPVIWLDDLGIEGPRLEVVWNESAVHLPPREMAAMLTLASPAGAPVTSTELARHIWPRSALVGPYDVRRVITAFASSSAWEAFQFRSATCTARDMCWTLRARVTSSRGHFQDISRSFPGVCRERRCSAFPGRRTDGWNPR